MKKSFVYGLVMSVSIFAINAYADPVVDASASAVTTKGYVDAGLKYVYKVANGTENGAVKNINEALSDGNGGLINVGDLKDKIGAKGTGGAAGTGLAGDVQSLEKTIGDANSGLVKKVNDLAASSNVYTAGDGIKVTEGANEGDPATIGIALPNNAENGVQYVFQSDGNGGGSWVALEVENSWNPGFLTNP